MPLIPGNMIADVLKITDETDPGFLGFPVFFVDDDPDNEIDTPRINTAVSENWANAVGSFLGTLVAPPGAGVAATSAIPSSAAAMKIALDAGTPGILELVDAFGAAIDLAAAAFSSVAGTFSLTPTPAIPDPLPPATSFEADVVAWVALGVFTPPGGSPTPWS